MFDKVSRVLESLRVVISNLRRQSSLRIGPLADNSIVIKVTQRVEIRTLRYLLILFNVAGYEIWLNGRLNRWTLSAARMLHWHPRTCLFWREPAIRTIPIYCTDEKMGGGAPRDALPSKTIQLHYDYSPELRLDRGHFAMAIPMHSQIYVEYKEHERLDGYRCVGRKMRVLFAGNWNEAYHNNIITKLLKKRSRYEIMSYLYEEKLARIVQCADDLDSLFELGYANELVLLEPRWLNQSRWLTTIAIADFFLCPPGIIMAWSHNIVEAMAVGTIPITNYPEWLVPPLEDGVNCLVFKELEELKGCLQTAKGMKEKTVRQMRENVVAYYREYLDPVGFVQKLLDSREPLIHLHLWDEKEEVMRRVLVAQEDVVGL